MSSNSKKPSTAPCLTDLQIKANIGFLQSLKINAFKNDHEGIDRMVKEMKLELKSRKASRKTSKKTINGV